ncbi:hypothetical protein [Variovorax sp.]|uniref:hypothetical protein n=1 Tax=Variovorax sp. TaxID=1871043 RepID=UPI002D6C5F31|nr:hypothetical protein [Variovorax sp.]HYP82805.1 hypothetical protein [Variovorax sp.]
MLAASAISDLSNVAARAMPNEIELRELVYEWLMQFDLSNDHIVLDDVGLVRAEYERNMPYNWREQEYGMRVLQNKIDHMQVDHVPIDTFEGNGEHIAVLEAVHEAIVTDREDRKWIACALAALILFDESPPIVYGAETDWHVARAQLEALGVCFQPLLPADWYRVKAGHP